MGSKPITQRAGTKYGSAPVNNEVTVDAGGKDIARFPRMSPLKQVDLIKGARDVGDSQNRPATWNKTEDGKETVEVVPGDVIETVSSGDASKLRPSKSDKPFYNPADPDQTWEEFVKADCGSPGKPKDHYMCPEDGSGMEKTQGPDQTIIKKEEGESYQGDLYAAQKGTATSSYRGRSDRRNVKATTKDQYKNKLRGLRSKIGGDILDAEGNPTGQKYTREQFKKDKQAARVKMFEDRQTAFDNQQENLQRQIEQGRIKGESYRRPDRVKTYGDYGDDKQIEMGLAQQKADRARNEAAAAETRKALQKNYFQSAGNSLGLGSDLNYKTSTPSLTKPKNLMYDLSRYNNFSFDTPEYVGGEGSLFNTPRAAGTKRGYKMGGFRSKNK